MNPVDMLTKKEKGPSFFLLLIPAAISLFLSATTLVSNSFYQQLRNLTVTAQGGSMFDLFIVIGCFVIMLVAFLDSSKIVYAHYLSGLLFVPSAIGLSNADWLAATGFKGGFATFRSSMTEADLLFIGLIILALFLFHFSTVRTVRISAELRNAGGDEKEVNAAVDHLVLNRVWLVVLSFAATLVVYGVISWLGPWFGSLLVQRPGLFVVVMAIAAVAAVALFIYLLRTREPILE
ncbi:MAG: hypothetical protein ACM3L5_00760 [Candidatus Saccharibacteria bacterium]